LYDRPLSDINVDDIERWQTGMEEKGRDSETIKRNRAEIESLYTHALREKSSRWNWISQNPIAGLTPIKAKPPEQLKPRYLSPEETTRLMAALRDRDTETRQKAESGNKWREQRGREPLPPLPQHFVDHLEPMVILSLKTGIRQGELFQLEWQDIELDYSAVNIRASTTKSGKARIVPMARPAKEALEKWRDQTTSNRLVFTNKNGNRFDNCKSAWRSLMTRARLDNFRWHDMRHDFASQLVIRNVSIQKVSKLLGHADIKTTMRYAHLSRDALAAAVGVLD
jgi:integrase